MICLLIEDMLGNRGGLAFGFGYTLVVKYGVFAPGVSGGAHHNRTALLKTAAVTGTQAAMQVKHLLLIAILGLTAACSSNKEVINENLSEAELYQQAQADLGEVDNLPPLGHDMVRNYTETKKTVFLKGKVYYICCTGAKIMVVCTAVKHILSDFMWVMVLGGKILVQYVPVCDLLSSRRLLVQIP